MGKVFACSFHMDQVMKEQAPCKKNPKKKPKKKTQKQKKLTKADTFNNGLSKQT